MHQGKPEESQTITAIKNIELIEITAHHGKHRNRGIHENRRNHGKQYVNH